VSYRALPSQLHETAEAAVRFFGTDRGILKSKFKVEAPVSNDLDYLPTLQANTPDHSDVWIEVSETPYLTSLDSAVLHCMKNCLPVKLYVAFPAGISATTYKKCTDEARTKGVGVLEVANGKCTVIHEALLLSLLGVRSEDRSQFPAKYRSVLSTAEATFRNGDPAKGCALVYDEIEALSRRLATKIKKNNWWTHLGSAGTPTLNFQKDAWASVMDTLMNRANFNALPPTAKKSLLMRVAALTDPRNETGHKPKNRAVHIQRDRELRTRFETAVDVLRDFAKAVGPLKI
jgi:hypothetical protein